MIVRSSPLIEAESAGVPLTVKSPAVIEAGSIGSEKVSEKVVGAAPVTTEPAAGIARDHGRGDREVGDPGRPVGGEAREQRGRVLGPAPERAVGGIDADAAVIAPAEGEVGVGRVPALASAGVSIVPAGSADGPARVVDRGDTRWATTGCRSCR